MIVKTYSFNTTNQSMTLFENAATNPMRLKLSSVAEHNAKPLIIGRRDMFTSRPADIITGYYLVSMSFILK